MEAVQPSRHAIGVVMAMLFNPVMAMPHAVPEDDLREATSLPSPTFMPVPSGTMTARMAANCAGFLFGGAASRQVT